MPVTHLTNLVFNGNRNLKYLTNNIISKQKRFSLLLYMLYDPRKLSMTETYVGPRRIGIRCPGGTTHVLHRSFPIRVT